MGTLQETGVQFVREDNFRLMFQEGSVRSVEVVMLDGKAFIHFVMNSGALGQVETKRGQAKSYRIETALSTLRAMGVVDVRVDMRGWQPSQPSLL